MSSTNFINGTVVLPSWLNDVNSVVYGTYYAQQMGILFTSQGDSTTTLSSALALISANGGGTLFCPSGTCLLTSTVVIPHNVTILGQGRIATVFSFSNSSDGFKSTSPINSSTGVRSRIENCGVTCTNPASTGGGFVDVGGTFIDINNVFFQGWNYQIILDQTEICTISNCEFLQESGQIGIWLVNGPDHTTGANSGYTNRITISNNQFNAATGAGENILDDGGVTHAYYDNNFNVGAAAIRLADVSGLRIQGNSSEGHTGAPIQLESTTKSGTYVGPCNGGDISGGNSFSDITTYHILIDDAVNISITDNSTAQPIAAFVGFGTGTPASGVLVDRNTKLVTGTFRTAAPFLAVPTSQIIRNNRLLQPAHTYSSNSIGSGLVAVTPATMEAIKIGTRLVIINADGSSGESVQVTNITSTTFSATFANSHTANFIIRGITTQDEEEGTWTPTIAGSTTAGSNTYSTQAGTYIRRGNFVNAKFNITVSTKDAAMAGALQILGLPYVTENLGNQSGVCAMAGFTGLTFPTSFTQLGGTISSNSNIILLLRSGSGVAFSNPQASEAGTTFTLVGEVNFYTSSV